MQTDFIGELEAKLRRYWAGESSDQIAYIGNIAVEKITSGTFSTSLSPGVGNICADWAGMANFGIPSENVQQMANFHSTLKRMG